MREVRCIRAGPSYYAVVAGIFAALSAILTKLTFSSDLNFMLILMGLSGCIGCNITMWCAYTNAMRLSASSLKVTLINTGVNFFLTGIAGRFLFHELRSLFWWFGIFVVFCGICIVLVSDNFDSVHGKSKKVSH